MTAIDKGDVNVGVGGQKVGDGTEKTVDIENSVLDKALDRSAITNVRKPCRRGPADEAAGLAVCGNGTLLVDAGSNQTKIGDVRSLYLSRASQPDKAAGTVVGGTSSLIICLCRCPITRCTYRQAPADAIDKSPVDFCLNRCSNAQ